MKYTHIGINDQARAIAALPVLQQATLVAADTPRAATAPEAALQMRCISGGSEGHSMSLDGNQASDQKRQNPRSCKGFDVVWQWMSEIATIGATGDAHFLTT
jgi:hypothetical protein